MKFGDVTTDACKLHRRTK